MACPPDATVRDMAAGLVAAMGHLEAAIKEERRLEKTYRRGMAALLGRDDLRDVTARRELYRRCSRIGENVDDIAERVIYAVVKES